MPVNLIYEKQKNYFINLIKQNSLGHAYLFSGQDSEDKRIFAENICAMLTGRDFGNNPDLKFIRPDAKETPAPSSSVDCHSEKGRAGGGAGKHRIDIESIRDLKSFMFLKPHSSEYKLAVIEDAETISDAAANAMLKILEEPPKHSVIILISSKPRQLPATILSRCETVVFLPQPEIQTEEADKALAELRKVVKQSIAERIKYAKQLHEKEDYAELVNLWLRSLRLQFILSLSKGEHKPAAISILKNLLRLSYIVSQPQYNHRIALENFFINL